jgi:hypothetical protein
MKGFLALVPESFNLDRLADLTKSAAPQYSTWPVSLGHLQEHLVTSGITAFVQVFRVLDSDVIRDLLPVAEQLSAPFATLCQVGWELHYRSGKRRLVFLFRRHRSLALSRR